MIRSRTLSMILMLIALVASSQVQADASQSQADGPEAVLAAYDLSVLESEGKASALYDRLHPDAKEIIPEEAVVGWYENDFFSLDPQPITEITGVEFVTWTWPVTGVSYQHTAEVSYVQPFGTGANVTYTEEIVRLVEKDGEWHWFFGRSREFVDTQLVRFPADSTSSESRAQTSPDIGASDMTSKYSIPVSCSSIEAVVGDVFYANCDWPFLHSAPLYCLVTSYDSGTKGGVFLCNPSSVPDFQNPDEIVVDFAPKLVYTVPVHCDVYTQGYQKEYVCDWPPFTPRNPECVVDESRLTFPYEQYLLCKP